MPAPDDRFATGDPHSPANARPELRPVQPDDLPSLRGGEEGGLSSLAQSARQKQISNARWTLIVIGVLSILVNVVMIFLARGQIDDEIRKAGFDPRNLPPELAAQIGPAVALSYLILGAFTAVGVSFIVLGYLTPKYPVVCTVTGLVLYVSCWVISGMLDPKNFAMGIIIKVIIIIALARAIQAALASEREKQAALAGMDYDA